MDMFFHFCLICFTPVAFGVLLGLFKRHPEAAILMLAIAFFLAFARARKNANEWQKDYEHWEAKSKLSAPMSRSAPPMNHSNIIVLFFEGLAACSIPFGIYLLSKCGTSLCY